MLYGIIGLALCYLAIRYGLARPAQQRPPMLSGGVGVVICVVMILLGVALVIWGLAPV